MMCALVEAVRSIKSAVDVNEKAEEYV